MTAFSAPYDYGLASKGGKDQPELRTKEKGLTSTAARHWDGAGLLPCLNISALEFYHQTQDDTYSSLFTTWLATSSPPRRRITPVADTPSFGCAPPPLCGVLSWSQRISPFFGHDDFGSGELVSRRRYDNGREDNFEHIARTHSSALGHLSPSALGFDTIAIGSLVNQASSRR